MCRESIIRPCGSMAARCLLRVLVSRNRSDIRSPPEHHVVSDIAWLAMCMQPTGIGAFT